MAILVKTAMNKNYLDEELLKKADLTYVNDGFAAINSDLDSKLDIEVFDESVYVANSVIASMQAVDIDYASRIKALEEQNPNLNTNIVNLATAKIGDVKIFMGEPKMLAEEMLDGWFSAYLIDEFGAYGNPQQYLKADFLEAYNFFGDYWGSVIGDETGDKDYFYLPLTKDYFLRNNGSFSGYRSLVADGIKSFSLVSDSVTPTTVPHSHSNQPHNHSILLPLSTGSLNLGGTTSSGHLVNRDKNYNTNPISIVIDNSTVVINPFTVTSRYLGIEETRPKNVGVIYLYKLKNVIPQNITDNLNGSVINWKRDENLSIEDKFNKLEEQIQEISSLIASKEVKK